MERADALWHLFVKELMKFGVVGALAFVINATLTWILMHTPWFEDSHIKGHPRSSRKHFDQCYERPVI